MPDRSNGQGICLNNVIITGNDVNSMHFPITLFQRPVKAIEVQALLDSGASHNLINYKLVAKHRLYTTKLLKERVITNAD